MPKFQGQTDKPLKVQLQSSILGMSWGLNEVAHGGRITLEIQTHWVSDGSDIQITVKDLQGGTLDLISGKLYSNYFRTQYKVAKPNKTGGMNFEAELKAHGLKAIGPKVRVGPLVKIKDCKWLDEKGQSEVKAAEDGLGLTCQATVEGAPPGAKANASVMLRLGKKPPTSIFSLQTPVQNGKVQFKWKKPFPKDVREIQIQSELDKMGGTYSPPEYLFSTEVLGVSAESAPLAVVQHMILTYEFSPGEAGQFAGKKIKVTAPDGSMKEYAIPSDGKIDVPKTLPGEYQIDNSEVDELL